MKRCSTPGCEKPVKMTGDKCEDCFEAVCVDRMPPPSLQAGGLTPAQARYLGTPSIIVVSRYDLERP